MVSCAVLFARILKILTFVTAPAMLALGISGVFSFIADWSVISLILSGYVLIFGILIIFSELGWKRFLAHFAFLQSRRGRSIFYMFCGTICICVLTWPPVREVMGAVVGACSILVGILQFLFSYCDKSLATPPPPSAQQGQGPLSQQPAMIGSGPGQV